MCKDRNSTPVKIGNKTVRLDRCIATMIAQLNKDGISTQSSCCGHGIYESTIVVKILDKNIVFLNNTKADKGIVLPRIRKFYKKDSKGFYFIPEAEKIKDTFL